MTVSPRYGVLSFPAASLIPTRAESKIQEKGNSAGVTSSDPGAASVASLHSKGG
jgi:hypothetical protein